MTEIIGEKKQEKEVIDVPLAMFFTVTLATKKRPTHILVKAETALDALIFSEKELKAPAVGCHITEYTSFLDAISPLPVEESTNSVISNVEVEEVTNQEIKVEEK